MNVGFAARHLLLCEVTARSKIELTTISNGILHIYVEIRFAFLQILLTSSRTECLTTVNLIRRNFVFELSRLGGDVLN